MRKSIYIGFDPREAAAYAVARSSIVRRLTQPIPVHGVILPLLQAAGMYVRPTHTVTSPSGHPQLIDELSKRDDYSGAMSTEFAISRFFIPHLELIRHQSPDQGMGWALFVDGDILATGNVARIFDLTQDRYAVMCVKHNHVPEGQFKMDGQEQSKYHRKNWSSVMLFNLDHPSNTNLTENVLNTLPGRDLHAFCWLDDDEIGELPPAWNYLVGHTQLSQGEKPQLVHFTDGAPCMAGYEDQEYAEEWRRELAIWAR